MNDKKKIVLPDANGIICNDFHKSRHFRLFYTDIQSIISEEVLLSPQGSETSISQWLISHGVTEVIACNIGESAIELFCQNKINVFTGVIEKSTRELVMDYLIGILETSCKT